VNVNDLAVSLRACAAGLCPVEAGTELLIANGTFLHRDDFTSRFISHATSGTTPMAAIDWAAATAALHTGELPCSGGERRILQLAASLAEGVPVDLRDTVTGLDDHNAARLLVAIGQAAGKRTENIGPKRTNLLASIHRLKFTGGLRLSDARSRANPDHFP
jgi:hypothetical protein